MAEISEIKESLDRVGALLSQDLHDFKCAGSVTHIDRFNKKLSEYSRLMKQYTALWQKERGYG